MDVVIIIVHEQILDHKVEDCNSAVNIQHGI